MKKQDAEEIRSLLMREKSSILNRESLHIENDQVKDEIDLATTLANNEFNNTIQVRNLFYLTKIDKAFIKLNNGTYGICENCEEEINLKRLLARPITELCLSCKEHEENVKDRRIYA